MIKMYEWIKKHRFLFLLIMLVVPIIFSFLSLFVLKQFQHFKIVSDIISYSDINAFYSSAVCSFFTVIAVIITIEVTLKQNQLEEKMMIMPILAFEPINSEEEIKLLAKKEIRKIHLDISQNDVVEQEFDHIENSQRTDYFYITNFGQSPAINFLIYYNLLDETYKSTDPFSLFPGERAVLLITANKSITKNLNVTLSLRGQDILGEYLEFVDNYTIFKDDEKLSVGLILQPQIKVFKAESWAEMKSPFSKKTIKYNYKKEVPRYNVFKE